MSDAHEEITAAAKAIEEMDLPGGVAFNEGTNYRIALVALAAAAQVRNLQREAATVDRTVQDKEN